MFAEQAHERAERGTEQDQALTLLALGWAMMYGEHRASAVEYLERAASCFERLGDDWHRALALSGLALATPDTATALTRLAHAADLFGRLHDHVKRANCLNHMAIRAIEDRTRLDDTAAWLTEAGRLAQISGNDHERLHAEVFRACLDQHRGDHATAETRFGGLIAEFRRIGDRRCTAHCLLGLGRAATFSGDHERARHHLAEGVDLAVGVGDLRAMVTGLRLLAESDHATGRFRRATTLLGAAERLDPRHREVLAPDLRTALRDRLGPAGFASALAAGHRTPLTSLLSH